MPAQLPERLRDLWRGPAWLLLVVMLVAQVWGLYLYSPAPGEPYFAHQDKLAHLLVFGAPFALALLLRCRPAALGILLHALLSEPLQHLVTTTRALDLWDTAANLVGMVLAGLGVVLLRRLSAPVTADEPAPAGVGR